jgi:hypothetical protein
MSLLAICLALGIVPSASDSELAAVPAVLADEEDDEGQPFDRTGKLRTGVVAIGGETTGVTLTAKRMTWELELTSDEQRELAEKLDGHKVRVRGTLRVRPGVEIKERRIVTVESLEEAE